ncbi:MBL fold metallo-hydrolase [Akkermansiaceae bacterium]|jgi:L-ascorbate metabolism protein UlaG (beta-lactamase superfamily)|nr:MBL fold metallo-hydrolase [Akkermansiaceae bacterium]
MSFDETSNEGYSGLFPKKGWPQRNYRFWRYRLLPQILKKREGESRLAVMTPPEEGMVRTTWIGHASVLVQFGQHTVIFDPNWANWHGPVKRQREPGLELCRLPELDLVLVSHAHFDHLHKPSLKVIEAAHGIVVPKGSGSLVKNLDFASIQEMAVWEECEIGGMRIVHTPSRHWGARYGADTNRDYGGFLVGSGDRKVFHAGDSAYFDGFKEIGRREDICVALLPIGAYEAPSGRDVHMNPEEALQAFEDLGAEFMLPMHYGTFPLGNEHPDEPIERLIAEAERRGIADRVIISAAGEGVEI